MIRSHPVIYKNGATAFQNGSRRISWERKKMPTRGSCYKPFTFFLSVTLYESRCPILTGWLWRYRYNLSLTSCVLIAKVCHVFVSFVSPQVCRLPWWFGTYICFYSGSPFKKYFAVFWDACWCVFFSHSLATWFFLQRRYVELVLLKFGTALLSRIQRV